MSNSKREFENWAEMQSDSDECVYELFLSEDEHGNYVDGISRTAASAFRAGQESRSNVFSAPVGWKIVPIESTSAMDLAAENTQFDTAIDRDHAEAVWAAMITASPNHEQSQ